MEEQLTGFPKYKNEIFNITTVILNTMEFRVGSMKNMTVLPYMSFFESDIRKLNFYELDCGHSLKEISDNCFEGCKYLKVIKFPSNLKKIGTCCFFGNTSLKNVEIPESVESMGLYCFKDCFSIEKVILPKHLRKTLTSQRCFEGCHNAKVSINIEARTLGGDVYTIDYDFKIKVTDQKCPKDIFKKKYPKLNNFELMLDYQNMNLSLDVSSNNTNSKNVAKMFFNCLEQISVFIIFI